MRRNLNSKKDSLDLLLDTICNMFGSIILITLLIVIISANPKEETADSEPPQVDRDETLRRIESAEAQLQRLKEGLSKTSPSDESTDQIARLRQEILHAKAVLGAAKNRVSENQKEASTDHSAIAQDAAKAAAAAASEIVRLENAIETDQKRIAQLKNDLQSLETAIEKIAESRTKKIRLPRERTTSKDSTPIIFIYNEIYPVVVDDPSIRAIEIDEFRTRLLPIKGRGLSKNKSDLELILRRVGSNRYAACYVFPDSIEAFRAFRDLASAQGIEMGWEASTEVNGLVFTTKGGSSPKPQ